MNYLLYLRDEAKLQLLNKQIEFQYLLYIYIYISTLLFILTFKINPINIYSMNILIPCIKYFAYMHLTYMKSTMSKVDAVMLLNIKRYQSIIDHFINNQSCSQMDDKIIEVNQTKDKITQ